MKISSCIAKVKANTELCGTMFTIIVIRRIVLQFRIKFFCWGGLRELLLIIY